MYHLTTDTGLDIDASTPADVGAALRTEIDTHAHLRPVGWAIGIDGLPGQHLGNINVYLVERDSTEFIDDTVQDVVQRLVDDPAPADHRTNADK